MGKQICLTMYLLKSVETNRCGLFQVKWTSGTIWRSEPINRRFREPFVCTSASKSKAKKRCAFSCFSSFLIFCCLPLTDVVCVNLHSLQDFRPSKTNILYNYPYKAPHRKRWPIKFNDNRTNNNCIL